MISSIFHLTGNPQALEIQNLQLQEQYLGCNPSLGSHSLFCVWVCVCVSLSLFLSLHLALPFPPLPPLFFSFLLVMLLPLHQKLTGDDETNDIVFISWQKVQSVDQEA